jgi:hypothetical protein
VQFQTSGGLAYIPRLAAPVAIDVDALGDQERRTLEQLIADARFFDLPARIQSRGGADRQSYTITIQDGARAHTVSVSDPVQDPGLQKLIQRLRELGDAERRKTGG